ncbi:Hypothetical protein NGAL_HAMBI490_54910 [Neorhizobium galegae bv. officinalis]|nr:Hypothetical protein NGAL_HAMBI490_54910 [Neorhizobium galegae bv. officinalis]
MPIRKMLFVSGALTAIVATVLPLKVVAGADGMLRVALSSVAAQEGNGNGGGGSNGGNGGENGNGGSGGNGNGNGGDNAGGDSGNSGNGNGNSGGNGNGNAGGADNGTGGSGTGAGAGSASAGGAANPGRAPAQPATPVAPAKAGVEVDVRGSSITVRHQNGATERISQGRYEMRDSRSRTIVNRTATPSDASRLRSFGR